MEPSVPAPPAGTREGGSRLWSSVVDGYVLEEHELVLLREATRTVDQLDALAAIVARDGVMDEDTGKAHPAVVEGRQLRQALARTLASLRLPSGDADQGRPQKRVGVRKPYAVGSGPARPRRVS